MSLFVNKNHLKNLDVQASVDAATSTTAPGLLWSKNSL